MDKLEATVEKLESGDLSLEESMTFYQEGIKLSAELQKMLEDARRKVEVIRQGAGGEYVAEPLEGENE
ncbi:MAG: exodeoxyribonuclease VII small subunit [Holophagaceae bacterium]|nr:exodeoxyribonuclease VII small subunit [Holophagaceae bacterium]